MTVEEIKAQLDYTLQNTVKQTINNYVKVVKFDPMIQGRFKKILFSEMIDVTGNVEWHRDSVSITDVDLTNTLIYVDRVYGLTNEKTLSLVRIKLEFYDGSYTCSLQFYFFPCWALFYGHY